MKALAEYANQLNELVRKLQAEMAEIKADGILEYEEYLSGKKTFAEYLTKLKNLKKEVSLDMKQIRAQYKGAVLLAKSQYEGKDEAEYVESLRLEEHEALRPYDQVIQTIDRLLLGAATSRQKLDHLAEDFERMKVEALPLRPDAAAAAKALAEAKQAQADDSIAREEVGALLDKWRVLIEDLDQKLAGADNDPLHAALLKGAKRSLELAVGDLSALLEDE